MGHLMKLFFNTNHTTMKKIYLLSTILLVAFQLHAQWSINGSDIYNSNSGNVGIGTSSPGARLEVYAGGTLGSSTGNSLLLSRVSMSGNTNYFQNNLWLRRASSGSSWLSANLHDGISIDGSFQTPGSDTRTWWERDPFHDFQYWGTGGSTYMSLEGSVYIGGGYHPKLSIYYMTPTYVTAYGVEAVYYTTLSDARFKEKDQPITNGLEIVKKLAPKEYSFRKGLKLQVPDGKQSGLYAQELEKVLPHLVSKTNFSLKDSKTDQAEGTKEYLGVNYIGLIPYLISAIQEQQKTIEKQEVLIQSILNEDKKSKSSLDLNHDLFKPRLFTNAPNPFNDNTEIKYYLPNGAGSAIIYIYNLTGEQISRYENLAEGANSITINKGTLKAGIYIYSLISNGQVWDSKRMVLVD